MDVTERICDRLLPENEGFEDDDSHSYLNSETEPEPEGPVFRAGKISKKFKRQAFSKLKSLQLRDTTKPLVYCVDLIQYAAVNFGPTSALNVAHSAVDYAVSTTSSAAMTTAEVAYGTGEGIFLRVKPVVSRARTSVVDVNGRSFSRIATTISEVPRSLPVYAEQVLDSTIVRAVLNSSTGRAVIVGANRLAHSESAEDAKKLAVKIGLAAMEHLLILQEANDQIRESHPMVAESEKLLMEMGHRLADPIYETILILIQRFQAVQPLKLNDVDLMEHHVMD